MIKLVTMTIPEFLNKKFLEWQLKTGVRKTLDDYAEYLNVKRPLLSMWLNGSRYPGDANKEKLIEMYGDEAVLAFEEDPDLHAVQKNWEYINPETRRHIRAEVEQRARENLEQSSKKRRTPTAD